MQLALQLLRQFGRNAVAGLLHLEPKDGQGRAKFMRTGFGAVLDIMDTPMEG